jgi:putative transposase
MCIGPAYAYLSIGILNIAFMPKRKVNLVLENYYHIYNRGNSKQTIFLDDEDYKYFQWLLYISNSSKHFVVGRISGDIYSHNREDELVAIGSYCLMPNHFHILITQLQEDGVSKFMQKVSTAYVMYFNKKYKRTGGLFEGRYKAKNIEDDIYLKYLYAYIHLNPLKLILPKWKEEKIKDNNKIRHFLKTYQYSSYVDYDNKEMRKEKIIINTKKFPDYFSGECSHEKEIFSWIQYKDF